MAIGRMTAGTALAVGLLSTAAAAAAAAEIELPGEAQTNAPVSCAPFPDRMSAFVWRNWFVVPHARLAEAVGAGEAELEELAAEMGLPRKVGVLPAWRRQGYITVLRRNWHLLDYPQLLKVLDMDRAELRFRLLEDDFLYVKLGNRKPKCGPLEWRGFSPAAGAGRRRRIAAILKAEAADDFSEEPRFTFIRELSAVRPPSAPPSAAVPADSAFGFRMIFSYFADYCDALADDGIASYPEGLLQKLADDGVNAVWVHTVLRTLAKDPKYPEFGEGCERRIANLNRLVARCAKYGIKVFLYMNEPRGMPDDFFRGHPEREAFRGADCREWTVWAMCTSCPEVRRWVRDSLRQVFAATPGLGGIFTITMSENLTNCPSRGRQAACPRCSKRHAADIVAEINSAMIEGMHAGNPDAVALLYDWEWERTGDVPRIVSQLPKRNVRLLSVSEGGMPVDRGGVTGFVGDYSISAVGPSGQAKRHWALALESGMAAVAKVQVNSSWELSPFPYLPVADLVAEHAVNLRAAGVDGAMLSWSVGCCPSPNLRIFRDLLRDDPGKDAVLDRLAASLYGDAAVKPVRAAWRAYAEGFRSYPLSTSTIYNGPHHWGPANPLYLRPTGYRATMVGIPYDDIRTWRSRYPEAVWQDLMAKVADGFAKGTELFAAAMPAVKPEARAAAARELAMFRAETLHFRSSADQMAFYRARNAGDHAEMARLAARELASAKELLALVRADSRFGYESSNQYFYIPQDIREKILTCRLALEER